MSNGRAIEASWVINKRFTTREYELYVILHTIIKYTIIYCYIFTSDIMSGAHQLLPMVQ